jgi:hypothetical protein
VRISTKLGYFSFDNTVPASHATLIVDSVLGQWFNPDPQEPRLRNKEDIEDFILNRLSDRLAIHEVGITLLVPER